MSYTNADGLRIFTNGEQGIPATSGQTVENPEQVIVQTINLRTLGSTFGAANIDPYAPFIPAGSVITGATLVMTAAATSGGSATLTIGTYNAAGTAIDADGIDATVALTAIDAVGDVVRCDGAQVTGVLGYVSANAYIGSIFGTAAYTAGEAVLIVSYVKIA